MKNQYFGDNRDLFKYDLICQIMKAGVFKHFTFIPMLTEPDASKQGGETNRSKAKAGTKNTELKNFLDKCINENRRDIKQLGSFFRKQGIEMKTYYEKDKYFSDMQREEYFEQIGNTLLSNSLVFVDPDKGLQITRSREQHILYCEVKDLYERMDKKSILMIYQHYPRMRTKNYVQEYFCERSEKLKNIAGDLPIYIDDNEIRFFFLTKDKSPRKLLAKTISDYGKTYKLKVGNV